MRRNVAVIALALAVLASAYAEDPWADAVVSYGPVNVAIGSEFGQADKALGAPRGDRDFSPNNRSIVSLGTQGGTLTLKFDTPVTDDAANPMGLDCIVFSNAFFSAGDPQRKWQEPALIEISEDTNGNGEADDAWYMIPGSREFSYSPFPALSEATGQFNDPPEFDPLIMAGTIRNPNVLLDEDTANDTEEYNWGYAEMTPTLLPYLDNYLRPDDPMTVGISEGSGGGDAFDIAWAVDSAGEPARITQFDFIRLTAFIDRDYGGLGFASPEIQAVADVAPDVDTDSDGILDEYETRVAGTDPSRPESTVLPLEKAGVTEPGTLLGEASDGSGASIRLYCAGERTTEGRALNCTFDILEGAAPAKALGVAVIREFVASEADFVAAEVQPAEITIAYTEADVEGMNESELQSYRYDGAAYTQDGMSDINVDTEANEVTFRTASPGVFVLAADENGAGGGGTGPGPGETLPVGGAGLLAVVILAAGTAHLLKRGQGA